MSSLKPHYQEQLATKQDYLARGLMGQSLKAASLSGITCMVVILAHSICMS